MSLVSLLRLAGVSGLLHLYIALRLLPWLSLDAWGVAAGASLLLASALLAPAPLLYWRARRKPVPDLVAWMGYLAMGVFSSLFVLTLLRDLVLLGATLFGAAGPGLHRDSAILVVLLTVLVTVAGLFNARRLARVVEVSVPIVGLPDALAGFTIVQISDIHIGSTIKGGYLDAIVGRVNGLKPDLVALTGDLVDGSVARLAPHVASLARLSARHGVYAVTGNHEYYSGAPAWVAELRRLGLRVLLNQSEVLEHGGARLLVGGVTDYSAHLFDPAQRSDPQAALAGSPARRGVQAAAGAPAAQRAGGRRGRF